MNERPSRRFFHSLDGMRGIAAILVVIRHTDMYFWPVYFPENYLAVDLFFLLSGVVLANAYEKKLKHGWPGWKFAWIRTVRVYPLYILSTVLGLAYVLVGNPPGIEPGQLPAITFCAIFLLPHLVSFDPYPTNGAAWTLFFELAVNFFYGWTIRFLKNRVLICIAILSAFGLATGIYLSNSHSIDLGWKPLTFVFGFFRVGYSFFVGVLLERLYASRSSPVVIKKHANLVPWILLLLVSLLLMMTPSYAARPYFDFFAVIAAFPVIIYVALHFQPHGMAAKVCEFLGAISYPIYVLHWPVGRLLQTAMTSLLHIRVQDCAPWGGFALMAFLLPFCWFIQKYYDAPVRKRLQLKNNPPPARGRG